MLKTTASRLAAFSAGLALAAGSAAAIGAATATTPPFQDCLKVAAANAGFGTQAMADASHGAPPMIEPVPGSDGLRSQLAGLRLAPLSRTLTAGASTTWRFRIIGCDGNPVRHFDRDNTKLLHLIVVRTDLTGYQHLHPTLGADGTFTIELRTALPGSYRAIAEFVIDGRKYVLGTNLTTPGTVRNIPLPAPALEKSVDGYDVELQRPAQMTAGQESQLTSRITRHGQPINDLEAYLGSYGHLVALHAPEAAYSHVHPISADPGSGAITFNTELSERGTYRLFLQFQTHGRVHTVAFTQAIS
ncbi:MAG: hypothetical protein JO168_16950 [Solirubrobacterales bacterium]|nr:hypothetical protein [Solirubrobacterales bacterium]MBV9715905.1 hypothetical protein [Solirubrobacterales bacterium]